MVPHSSSSSQTALVRVDGTNVAWDVFDGCLNDGPVVGRGVDHRPVAGCYSDVRDAVAGLVEENKVAGFRVGGRPVSVLGVRGVGQVHAEVGEHSRGKARAIHAPGTIERTDVGPGVVYNRLSRVALDVRFRRCPCQKYDRKQGTRKQDSSELPHDISPSNYLACTTAVDATRDLSSFKTDPAHYCAARGAKAPGIRQVLNRKTVV